MRTRPLLVSAVILAALAAASPARADKEPVIVYPGRPGVPVMWFGQDISWAVVEGDWGLDRPGHGQIGIIPPNGRTMWGPAVGPSYYPSTGRQPRYGRDEKEPAADRKLPPQAEGYFRAWGAQSVPAPATMPPDYPQQPLIVSPEIDMGRRNLRRGN